MHSLTLSSAENVCTFRQHGCRNVVKVHYQLVSRRPSFGRGLFLITIIPRKGSLPLFSSSVVKLSEGWISFSVDKKTEAFY